MKPSQSAHEALLRMAVKMLRRWKEIEDSEATDDEFGIKWADLSDDISAFLETVRGFVPSAKEEDE